MVRTRWRLAAVGLAVAACLWAAAGARGGGGEAPKAPPPPAPAAPAPAAPAAPAPAAPAPAPKAPAPKGAVPVMEKYVSKDANFVLYKPRGWAVAEGGQPTFRTLSVADPQGRYEAALFYGSSPTGRDLVALAKRFIAGIGGQFPDLAIPAARTSADRSRVVFDATFTVPGKGPREFRCWVSGNGEEFLYASIEGPAGALAAARPLLLTILGNVRMMRGAFGAGGPPPIEAELAPYRMTDGSATFLLPKGWRCQEYGRGCFAAGDPDGGYGFLVASVDLITPELGVTFPGAILSPYLAPNRAMAFLGEHTGLLKNMRVEKVFPRQDMARDMGRVYTAGPVAVEEFLYTCDTRGGKARAYSFGFSFGSRTGTNWNFRHLTVLAPAEVFDRYVGNFAAMVGSYKIDDQWAQAYVAQGMARLRQMQRETSAMVARNAQEIHDMMQAAYDERQRSMDYIDYQRTNYIRGTQDWVSSMEGGTVYHSDSWGTQNLTTGERWDGSPFDYVHFEGQSPKYNDAMQAIDSRALWERHVAP